MSHPNEELVRRIAISFNYEARMFSDDDGSYIGIPEALNILREALFYRPEGEALIEKLESENKILIDLLAATWNAGFPTHPFDKDWFIAETKYGDRIVLKALSEENSYDFTTADHTYMKKENVIRWRQFPDGKFKAYAAPPAAAEVVPDGWKFVPEQATPEMIEAGFKQVPGRMYGDKYPKDADDVYDAMLAAAPASPLPVALSQAQRWAVSEAAELLNALAAWERENGTLVGAVKLDEVEICAIVSDWSEQNAARRSGPALTELLAAASLTAASDYLGEVVVTKNADGVIVAVTRQAKDGKILEVIAEGVAVDERISNLEAECAPYKSLSDANCESTSKFLTANKRVRELEKALTFYAGNKHWYEGLSCMGSNTIMREHGDVARAALAARKADDSGGDV